MKNPPKAGNIENDAVINCMLFKEETQLLRINNNDNKTLLSPEFKGQNKPLFISMKQNPK